MREFQEDPEMLMDLMYRWGRKKGSSLSRSLVAAPLSPRLSSGLSPPGGFSLRYAAVSYFSVVRPVLLLFGALAMVTMW